MQDVHDLIRILEEHPEWRGGEAGWCEGEQYEQYTVRCALAIFGNWFRGYRPCSREMRY